jgi:hypothetical protein
MPSKKLFAFELTSAIPIQTNKPSPVQLKPDPLLSTLGYRNESMIIFDGIILNDRSMQTNVFFKLNTIPLNICISFEPLTPKEMKNRTKCEVFNYKENNISLLIQPSFLYIYTRLFIHVYGN